MTIHTHCVTHERKSDRSISWRALSVPRRERERDTSSRALLSAEESAATGRTISATADDTGASPAYRRRLLGTVEEEARDASRRARGSPLLWARQTGRLSEPSGRLMRRQRWQIRSTGAAREAAVVLCWGTSAMGREPRDESPQSFSIPQHALTPSRSSPCPCPL